VIVVIDDHLLRDWMARRDAALVRAVGNRDLATTNLWYARLCRSAARAREVGILSGWAGEERAALIAGLVALPRDVHVVPMRDLAWRMGSLSARFRGLSALGAEAVAAAERLDARVLVSARDDGPGIKDACGELEIRYDAVDR
jgi:hypothetical protein